MLWRSISVWDYLTGLQTMPTVIIIQVLTRPWKCDTCSVGQVIRATLLKTHLWSGWSSAVWFQPSHWAHSTPSSGWELVRAAKYQWLWWDSNQRPYLQRMRVCVCVCLHVCVFFSSISVFVCVCAWSLVCVRVCVSFACTCLLLFYIITEKSNKHVHTNLTQVWFVCLFIYHSYVHQYLHTAALKKNKAVKCFESLKALCKVPIIIIVTSVMSTTVYK